MQHNIKIQEIIEIAIKAGKIAIQFYNKEYTIEQKQNKTPVTEADIAINNYLIDKLSKYNYPILSEESEDDFEKRKNANFVWIIDPLDGTADFIQKTGEFSIMIGLVNKKGESILGVVYAPALDELYYAQKNKGAFQLSLRGSMTKQSREGIKKCNCEKRSLRNNLNKKQNKNIISTETKCSGEISNFKKQKLQVNKNSIKNRKILTSRNHLGEHEQEIAKKYNMQQIPAGSAGLKTCWIARRDAELYINSSNKSGLWDTCAADIILTEAGGSIVDKNNDRILYNTKDTILQNGYIVSNETSTKN